MDSNADPLAEILRAAGSREAPPEAHYDAVRAVAREAWQKKVASRRRRNWYALAAGLAAAAGLAVILSVAVRDPALPSASVSGIAGTVEIASADSGEWVDVDAQAGFLLSGSRIRTGLDGRADLALAGGGSLRLDSGTELALGTDEFALVSGTVYFDSYGRPEQSAIAISTGLGVVTDIGTQFEVHYDTNALRVRVRTGQVSLIGTPLGETLISHPGEEIGIDAAGTLRTATIEPDGLQWNWTASLARPPSSRGTTVLDYLLWIGRETGKELRFEPQSIEVDARLVAASGDVSNLTPLELLDTIEATSDFSFELTDDGAILIRRP